MYLLSWQKKCSQYWPDMGSAEFGKVTVTSVSVESYVDYTIRCFSVSRVRVICLLTLYSIYTFYKIGTPAGARASSDTTLT